MTEKKTKKITRQKIPLALKRLLSGVVAAAMMGTLPVSAMNVSAVTDSAESTEGILLSDVSKDAKIEISIEDMSYDGVNLNWYFSDETQWHTDGITITADGEPTDFTYDDLSFTLNGKKVTPATAYDGKNFNYEIVVSYRDVSETINAKIGKRGDANLDHVTNIRDSAIITKDLLQIYLTRKSTLTKEDGFGIFLGNYDYIYNDEKGAGIAKNPTNYYGVYDLNVRDAAAIAKNIAEDEIPSVKDPNTGKATNEKLSLSSDSTYPGGTVTLDVNVECNNNFESGDFVLSYDENLTSKAGSGNKTGVCSKVTDGSIKLAAFSNGSPVEDGAIAEIEFTIPADAEPGTVYNIDFSKVNIFAVFDGSDIGDSVSVSGGTITVTEPPATEPTEPPVYLPPDPWEGGKGIQVGKAEQLWGRFVQIPVYVRGTDFVLAEMIFTADFPVTLTGFSPEKINYVNMDTSSNDRLNIAAYINSDIPEEDTIIGYIHAFIEPDAEPGEYPIDVEIEQMEDSDGELINPVNQSGTVIVYDLEYESYDSDDDKVYDAIKIYGFSTTEKTFDIPDEIDGLPVKKVILSSDVFASCENLETINIPASVEEFNRYVCCNVLNLNVAEDNPNYSSIDGVLFNKDQTELIKYPSNRTETEYIIPDGVTTIGDYAFGYDAYDEGIEYDIALTSVVIPESVTEIGYNAFKNCTNLSEVEVSDNIEVLHNSSFGNTAFINNQKGVQYVGTWAVSCSENTKSAKIKEGTTHITSDFFDIDSKVTTMEIPKSLPLKNLTYERNDESGDVISTINYEEIFFFNFYNLEAINVAEGHSELSSVDGVLFNKDKTKLIFYPISKKDTEYTVPDGVEVLAGRAFSETRNLTKVILPETVTSIAMHAFWYCSSLKELIIPEGLETIEGGAFFSIDFEELVFPKSLKSLGGGAFEFSQADKITFLNPETVIPDSLFFTGVGAITIAGYKGSTAEEFVKNDKFNEITFEALEDVTPPVTTAPITTTTPVTTTTTIKTTTGTGDPSTSTTPSSTSTNPSSSTPSSTNSTIPITPTPPVTTTTAIKGDVSGNNKVDLMDVILVAKYILNPNTLTAEQLKIADFNGNGVVDLIDAIAIAKYMIKH